MSGNRTGLTQSADEEVSKFMKAVIDGGMGGMYGISRYPVESDEELKKLMNEAIKAHHER
jgi:hypothetical protein